MIHQLQWRISGVGSIHLTLWGILIEHSIVQHCGSGVNQSRKSISCGETNFLSNLLFLCVKGGPKRFYLLLTHSRNHLIFPRFFFLIYLFFKLAKAGKGVKYPKGKREILWKKCWEERQDTNKVPKCLFPLPLEYCAVHVHMCEQIISASAKRLFTWLLSLLTGNRVSLSNSLEFCLCGCWAH